MSKNGFEKRVALHRKMRLGVAPRASAPGGAWIANVSGDGSGGGGGAPGGPTLAVQYKQDATTFGGSANYEFDPVAQTVTLTGKTGTAALTVPAGFISAAEGFQAGGGNFIVDGTGLVTSKGGFNCLHLFNFDSIQTEGGLHVKHTAYGITDDGPYFSATTGQSASPPNPGSGAAGYGGLQHRYSGTWWYFDPDVDGSWNIVDFEAANSAVTSVVGGTGVTVTMNAGAATVAIGQGVATNASVTFSQVVTGSAGAPTDIVLLTQSGNFSLDNSGNVSSVGSAAFHGGFNCTNNFGFNSVQTMGGVYAGHSVYGLTTEGPLWTGSSGGPGAPDSSHVHYGALQHYTAGKWWYFDPDVTGSWNLVDFEAAANVITSVLGTANQITATPNGTVVTLSLPATVDTTTFNISASGTFTANGTKVIDGTGNGFFGSVTTTNATQAPVGGVNALTMVVGGGNTNALYLPNGGVTAQLGFYTPSSSATAIQAPAGGVSAATIYASLSTAFNTIDCAGGIHVRSATYGMTSDGPYFSKSILNPSGASIPSGYGALQHQQSSIWNHYIPGFGWASVDFHNVGGGVTSLIAGTGVTVSSATGDVTVAIGQAVATSNSVVFANVSSPGTADFTTGFHSSNSAATTVNIPNGGLFATQVVATCRPRRHQHHRSSECLDPLSRSPLQGSSWHGLRLLGADGLPMGYDHFP